MPETNSTTLAVSGKPAKPYPDFPLFPHDTKRWAKKIRGKTHYFGPWGDPDGALAKYLAVKDELHAGRAPAVDAAKLTINEIVNAFLAAKNDAMQSGELSNRTWLDYKSIMVMLAKGMGKHRIIVTLAPQDFASLKNKLAKRNGPHRMCTVIQVIRCAFRHAYESGLLDKPMRFGPAFKRTSKKTLRLHRARQGAKLFTAREIRRMIDASGPALRTMILLGVNCGFGNADCGTLPLSAVSLETGMIDYSRPKTGIPRRCALWPETVAAIREYLTCRPRPNKVEHSGLVFITKYGLSWSKDDSSGPVTQEMRKLLKRLGINGHRNFYALRHTFRTVADESRDQPAVDFCMGHEVPHMSAVYRETISDERLRAVAEQVRKWLFPSAALLQSVAADL